MKKKNLNSLKLNKNSISNLGQSSLYGGTILSISCQPVGICGIETQGNQCGSNGCPSGTCPTNGCQPTDGCPPSISCQPVGIC